MVGFLVTLLVIWVVLSVVGFIVKGLLWLAVLGIALFLLTAVWLWFKGRRDGRAANMR
ncbi:hypothetical protein VR010_08430 [Actinomycetaceae bacterium L2_0104]